MIYLESNKQERKYIMVNFGNDWDQVLAGEFEKDYYLKLR